MRFDLLMRVASSMAPQTFVHGLQAYSMKQHDTLLCADHVRALRRQSAVRPR